MGRVAIALGRRNPWILALLLGAVTAGLPWLGPGPALEQVLTLVAVYTLIVSGLNLSYGYGGELALGQVAVFASGAYATAILNQHGINELLVALPVSLVVAAFLGLVSGVPGLRLAQWSLALVSFSLLLVMPNVIQIFATETGGQQGLAGILDPSFAGMTLDSNGLYLFAVSAAIVWLAVVRNLVLSPLGAALQNMRQSRALVESLGISVFRLKITAYVLGSVPAGAAGCVFAYLAGFLSPDSFRFDMAVAVLAASILGGSASVYGAPLGAALVVFGPLRSTDFQRYALVAYGAFLVLVGVLFTGGISSLLRRLQRRLQERLSWPGDLPTKGDDARLTDLVLPGAELVVSGVTKRFGGLKALDEASVTAKPGQITAIIGPNGAGKTTLLNAISGFNSIDEGQVQLGQDRVDAQRPDRVAQLGVARTFQTPQIPRDVSVADVVESGRLRFDGAGILGAIVRSPSFRRRRLKTRQHAAEALRLAGLAELSKVGAQDLPLGTRRLLEVVRAVAGEPRLVLLDEPAAGLDDSAIAELNRVLLRLRDAGATVVLVEHNVRFVMGIADMVFVLNLGHVISSGPPSEIRNDPNVINSYLGRSARNAGAPTVLTTEPITS